MDYSFGREKNLPEIRKGEGLIIQDIFEMSSAQEEDLRKDVKRSDDNIAVFIHPFYNLHNTQEPIALKDLRYAHKVNQATLQAIGSADGPPVVIMEEYPHIGRLNKILENPKNDISNRVVIVKTAQGTSVPKALKAMDEMRLPSRQALEKNWVLFLEKLKKLGVKKIQIGGSFFWADERGGANAGTAVGCVGDAIIRLSATQDFEVKLSDFTNPDSRAEVESLQSVFKKYL